MAAKFIEAKNVHLTFTPPNRMPVTALKGFDVAVGEGEFVSIVGPSGCGKSTFLNVLLGLIEPNMGEMAINGNRVSGPGRDRAMVFQEFGLLPWRTVIDNIALAPELRGVSKRQRHEVCQGFIDMVGLSGFEHHYPHELSGGMKQRVGIARALVSDPDVLLMDEPFSNLDLDSRERMGQEIGDEFKANNVTCVIVTHDQNDAFALGDEVGVMSAGAIVQWDTPYNLYHQPVDRFVADFIGNGVFLPGQVISKQAVHTQLSELTRSTALDWPVGTEVEVLIRPDDVVQDPDRTIEATVIRRAFKGAEILYTLKVDANTILLALFPSHTNFGIGEKVGVRLEVDHLVAFPRQSAEELNKHGSS